MLRPSFCAWIDFFRAWIGFSVRSRLSFSYQEGMPTQKKLLYTVEEAAELLSISRSKVYDLMVRGDLESVKIGASRRLTARAMQSLIDQKRAER